MDIRVLGRLEAVRDGLPVYVRSGHKPRLVLAVLLARADRVVTTEGLIAAVWGDRPPASARRNVQQYVLQLRDALGGGLLARRDNGYVAAVGEHLDAARFRRLAAEGEAALACGEVERACRTLRAALDLWRGAAFAEFVDCPVVAAEAAGLEQLRLDVWERWADAELAAGRPDPVAAELAGPVRDNPFREGLCARWMRALHLGGRQVEALTAFRRIRVSLREELGLEPGHELRRLHEAILRGDEPHPAVPTPHELPPDVRGFTGRVEALRRLEELLRSGGTVVVVTGTAGAGKSALAVHWGHRVADRFPGGQLHLNLRGHGAGTPMLPVDALSVLLRTLGVPPDRIPTDPAEAAARFRSVTAGRRLLIVLDDALTAEQVRPMLPGGPNCVVVVTSRNRLTGLVAHDGAHRLALDVLEPDEGTALLTRLLGPGRAAAEPDAVAELGATCAWLPLALRIAAARLLDRPDYSIASYVADLRAHDPLALLAVEDDERSAVGAAFDSSYRALPESVRRIFRLSGLVSLPDFTAASLAASAGESDVAAALDVLTGAHLVEKRGPDRYALHDLLRAYAARQCRREDSAEERSAARTRLFEWYLDMVTTAADLLWPDRPASPFRPAPVRRTDAVADPASAKRWLDAEHHNLAEAIRAAERHGPRAYAWLLSERLLLYYLQSRLVVEWIASAETALAAARAEDDRLGRAAALVSLTSAHYSTSAFRLSAEIGELAASACAEIGWTYGEAVALLHIGLVLSYRGETDRAVAHLSRAGDLYAQIPLPYLHGIIPAHTATAMLLAGRLDDAMSHATRALHLARRHGALRLEAHSLLILGELNRQLGRFDTATTHLAEGLVVARRTAASFHEAATLCAMARVHRDTGHLDTATDHAYSALTIAHRMRDRRVEAEVRNCLGSVHLLDGHHEAAIAMHGEALRIAEEIDVQYQVAEAVLGLASVHQVLGDGARSATHADRALGLARKYGLGGQERRALAHLNGLGHSPSPSG
ncbi:BTAD domain-containing putative transcriptional regulator [Saccharothrix sp.]|uniref:AfsR/SARP family transcriptional regulator n=1 Tax=Saccharothrix sp. TaxID=1873460 RepID=UPI0028119938|nr:BTAD domain-containing putative transcriptional regulator [Saccharothrix sp.]